MANNKMVYAIVHQEMTKAWVTVSKASCLEKGAIGVQGILCTKAS